jgi:uncharacterized membrane protein
MTATGEPVEPSPAEQTRRASGMARLRNYFLTGLVIAAPLFLTIFITWTFVQWIDFLVEPLIPPVYRFDRYLPIAIPGFGVLVALVFITLLGFLTANFVGRQMLAFSESLLGRMPLVRKLYGGLKQIFETVISRRGNAFQKVALLEFPSKGLWSLVFISTDTRGEIRHRLGEGAEEMVSVFMPTTPNPTMGFLVFVKRRDLVMLDMSFEDAAKVVISGGLVVPEFDTEEGKPKAVEAAPPRPRRFRRFNPPPAA